MQAVRRFERNREQLLTRAVLLFPGQGTQHIGMGSRVCDISSETRAVWDCASDLAGCDMRRLCFNGPMTQLTDTRYQQVAITTVNISSLLALRAQHSFVALATAGHSVGEYAALYASGVLSLQDTLRAVIRRGRLMQELAQASAGGMYAIKGATHQQIVAAIRTLAVEEQVCVANDNTPRQQVVAGALAPLKRLISELLQQGCTPVKLPVSGAWHSPLMRAAASSFRAVLDSLQFNAPSIPLYMNMTASPVYDAASMRTYLAAHLYSQVRWRETMEALQALQPSAFVEIGPRKVLGTMLADFGDLQATVMHAADLLAGTPAHDCPAATQSA